MNRRPYRFDTTVFERENVKANYYGYDYPDSIKWNYKYLNQFDSNGNLVKVSLKVAGPHTSFTSYSYDSRNLLFKKQEQIQMNGKLIINAVFVFEYE